MLPSSDTTVVLQGSDHVGSGSFGENDGPIVNAQALDQVRGVLFALANAGSRYFDAVSTQSVGTSLRRRNREFAPAPVLDELHAIGDVQRLQGGFWLPCETHVVSLGEIGVVVSGMPTALLARFLDRQLFGEGHSRLMQVKNSESNKAPSRRFDQWCRAPASSVIWAQETVRRAQFSLSTGQSTIEVFNHWERRVNSRWVVGSPEEVAARGVALARTKATSGTMYFLVRCSASLEYEIAEFGWDWSAAFRMAFALRALSGNNDNYESDVGADAVRLSVPRYLPSEEVMVLRALGPVTHSSSGWRITVSVPSEAWSQVESMCQGLGLV